MWIVVAALVGLRSDPAPPPGGQCAEPRYRWSQKVDTSLAAVMPQPVSISAILGSWDVPAVTARDRCAPRAGRELAVYRVRGWVRRIETEKDDGDWHVELTDRRDSPPDSCIVAEIPLPGLGGAYQQARADLSAALRGRKRSKGGGFARPVEIWIEGAAFFDGHHRSGARRDKIAPSHGHCNASLRALWEIHPVYRVGRP